MGGSTRRVFSSGAAKQLREAQGWKRRATPSSPAEKHQPPSLAPLALKKPLASTTLKPPQPPHSPIKTPTSSGSSSSSSSSSASSSSSPTLNKKPLVVLPRVNRRSSTSTQTTAETAAAAAAAAAAASATAPPSFRDLRLLMLQRGVPFIGFGMVDNAIMIVAGDYIEMSIGVTLAIGTMTAAALGNIFADVIGLNLGGMIEEASHRMGLPEPTLSRAQKEMGLTKRAAYLGNSLGIAFGCLLGMLPLAFISNEAREESPVEVFQALARRTAGLVGAERAVIFQLDTATRAVVVQQYQGGEEREEGRESEGPGGLPLVLAQEVVEQVLESKVGLRMWSRRADSYYSSEGEGGKEEGVTSKEKRLIYRRQRSGGEAAVESLLCLPVLDKEGQVMAIVVAVNATKAKDFVAQDEKTLAGLCAHVAEALINMTRRPEEHVSLTENLELLSLHSEVGWKEYRPSLKALLFGEEEKRRQGGEGRNVPMGSGIGSETGVRGTQPLNVSAA